MSFDSSNKIVQLCAEGMNFEGEPEKARPYFQQAWDEASTNVEKLVAAHYLARQQTSVADKLRWDETALYFALQDDPEDRKAVFPSLYLNIGKCHEDLQNVGEARKNYQLAQSFAENLPDDGFGNLIRSGILNGLERVKERP